MPGQLHLFKGRRQRGVAAPLPKEFATHVAVAKTLRLAAHRDWLWTHFPAGELRDKAAAGKLKAMGLNPGFLDFVLISPAGVHHWLELKRGPAPLSDAQKAFLAALVARGVPCGVARSYEVAIELLRSWGVLRVSLTVSA